jgi:hypothetical protein
MLTVFARVVIVVVVGAVAAGFRPRAHNVAFV